MYGDSFGRHAWPWQGEGCATSTSGETRMLLNALQCSEKTVPPVKNHPSPDGAATEAEHLAFGPVHEPLCAATLPNGMALQK